MFEILCNKTQAKPFQMMTRFSHISGFRAKADFPIDGFQGLAKLDLSGAGHGPIRQQITSEESVPWFISHLLNTE